MRDGGKGDKQRPLGVPEEQFNNNWDNIFKKKNSAIYGVQIENTQEQWDAIFDEVNKKPEKEKELSVDIEASRDDVSVMVNLTEKF